MQCREGITYHPKECYAVLATKLKDDVINPLNFKNNTPEWFCMTRFSFTSATVHKSHDALIRMKINDLKELGFNKVHLNLFFDHIKSFNQTDVFEWDDNEDANYVDYLKYDNTNSCIER